MKKKIISYIFLLAALAFGSCSEFLDEPKPTTAVSASDVFASSDGIRAYFTGVYRNLRSQWESADGGAGGATDTWGVVGLKIAREVKGKDCMIPAGWYQWDYRHENREPTYRRVNFVWEFLTENANQANVLIKGIEENTAGLPDVEKNAFLGEARALRAWCYFNLVIEYQHNIPTAPGVPFYLVPTESASAETKGRGTVSEVYDVIIEDLEFAVANLGTSRILKSVINKNVAAGILARVYLTIAPWKGDTAWQKAQEMAAIAREGYELNAASATDGFNDMSSTEWIWGLPQSPDQTIYYGNIASHYDHFVLGYNSMFLNSELVESFSATDVRADEMYYNAYGDAAELPYKSYITRKFVQKEDFAEDIVMMRVAEMYLIEAEANAELGKTAQAQEMLFAVQSNRDPSAVASGNTGAALIDEILLERRKELFGEIGVSFLDAKRRRTALVRTGGNHTPAYNFDLPADDPRFILKIPQKEIDANPNITEADQNK